jgi:formyltetrahydrofolate deformylase
MAKSDGIVLVLSCPDRPGISHAVSTVLLSTGCNILSSQQHRDPDTERFFMRVSASTRAGVTVDGLRQAFEASAAAFGMDWRIEAADRPARALLLVSRLDHCLHDLLHRVRTGVLPLDVRGVVSNHPDLAPLADWHGVPFHHLPVSDANRPDQEAAILDLVEAEEVDLVVLARYMQVLSAGTCKRLDGRAINIHHSFLPSFAGARPYHQAYERGVKLIGATAHYVTSDLDEGPIIEQDVDRVDHGHTAAQLTAAGRDIESRVLARAVRWHAEHRVLLNDRRTVVFS